MTAAERAAEAIEDVPDCPYGYKLVTETEPMTRPQIIAAIIAREYAELEKAAEVMLQSRLMGDGNEYSDRYWKTDADNLRSALNRVRGQQ